MLKYNINKGIIHRRLLNIVFILFLIVELLYFKGYCRKYFRRNIAFCDIICGLFLGEYPAELLKTNKINFPTSWFTYYLITALYTAIYPCIQLNSSSSQILLRIGSRKKWWQEIYKYIFISSSVMIITTLALSILFSGSIESPENSMMWGMGKITVSRMTKVLMFMGPFVVQLALAAVTTVLFLAIGVIRGTVVLVTFLLAGIYFDSLVLFPGMPMFIRYNLPKNNIEHRVYLSLILCTVIILLAYFVGKFIFCRNDCKD